MRGERTGETYRLGDRVQVKLVEAAPVAGALRFELAHRRAASAGTQALRRAKGAKHRAARSSTTGKASAPERSGSPDAREGQGRAAAPDA